ncbi:UNVERIFIED_CONTAM: Protein Hook-like protein [Trichonephila clavipes]
MFGLFGNFSTLSSHVGFLSCPGHFPSSTEFVSKYLFKVLTAIERPHESNDGSGNETSIGDSELLDAVPPEIREKLIRLQHENKMLKINEGATLDKQLTLTQSMLDDAKSRINELETDNRLANRRIMELESQIEDLHSNQSAVSVQEDLELKQKLNSAIKRQKEADAEIQNCSVTIESLESQIEASVSRNQQLQECLNRKEDEMRAMEERYRRYLEKAKNVQIFLSNSKTCEISLINSFTYANKKNQEVVIFSDFLCKS